MSLFFLHATYPSYFKSRGSKCVLSEHLCQDPLEKFFGCHRQRGGTHDDPNAHEFYRNTQALRAPSAGDQLGAIAGEAGHLIL